MRKRWFAAGAVLAVAVGLYAANNSWSASPSGALTLMAHRGVAQPFSEEGLTRESCTAAKSLPVAHGFIENTLPSMRKAFDYGADVVEIDIHPTRDGEFAVFHDWTLECRTDGQGVTREHAMRELKALDVGYGYTRDGGRSYPLRGTGLGQMPTLEEVLRAFPAQRFSVNIKSNDPGEAGLLLAYLDERAFARPERLMFYGGPRPIAELERRRPELRTYTKEGMKACGKGYLLHGWRGRVPEACRNTVLYIPYNLGWLMWGWPDRFLQRMQGAGTEVFLGGSAQLKVMSVRGLDSPDALGRLPRGWRGGVMTDRVELVGPALKPRGGAGA